MVHIISYFYQKKAKNDINGAYSQKILEIEVFTIILFFIVFHFMIYMNFTKNQSIHCSLNLFLIF